MGSRLIAIACLVVSLLSTPSLARADYRSDHDARRTGARAAPSAPRNSSSARHARPTAPDGSRVESRSERTNRLPRLLLLGVVLGGGWLAYRKYGRAMPPAQLARYGGLAAVGLALVYYVVFAGRTSRRDVAATDGSLGTRPRSNESRSERPQAARGSEARARRDAEVDLIPDHESDVESPAYRTTTRRDRLSGARRGTLYDHPSQEFEPSPSPAVEPEIPVDPELMAAISRPTQIKPPGPFADDSARPLDRSKTVRAAANQTPESMPARSSANAPAKPSTKPTADALARTVAKPTTKVAAKPVTKNSAKPAPATANAAAAEMTTPASATRANAASPTPPTTKTVAVAASAERSAPSKAAGKSNATANGGVRPNRAAAPADGSANIGIVPANYQPAEAEQPESSNSSSSGGSSSGGAASSGTASGEGGTGQSGAIGIAPPKEVPEFLRQESVLLDPGEYQIEVGLLYTLTQSSSVLQLSTGDATFVGDLERRQRLMLTTLDLRVGITPKLQGSILLPFGWSSGETVFAGQDQVSSTGGIGDIALSLTRLIREGDQNSSQILMNLAMSAPTGESNFVSSVSTPGSQLGQGFYTMTGGITFVRVFDPLVMFGGFGLQHRFDTEVAPGITLSPGELAYYRFGIGWAVNTRVTLNGSFSGSYLTDIELNNRRVAGTSREPMSLRLAATIARAKRHSDTKPKLRTVEPHLQFGLTESAPAVQMGISWSY